MPHLAWQAGSWSAVAALLALQPLPAPAQAPADQARPDAARPPSFRPPWPDDRTPVALNMPREYESIPGSFQPSATGPSIASIFLDYPAMRPWPFAVARCRSRCEGQVYVQITTGSASEMNVAAWRRQRDIRRVAAEADPRKIYTPVPPPSGYTHAWEWLDREPPGLPMPVAMLVFLREDAEGRPGEYAECVTRETTLPVPEPVCTVHTALDGMPAIQLELRYNMRHWPERDAIKAAVMRLVRSWL